MRRRHEPVRRSREDGNTIACSLTLPRHISVILPTPYRPHEIDEAARRRLVKRLYIPLPEAIGRRTIVVNLLRKQRHSLTDADIDTVVARTEGAWAACRFGWSSIAWH